jgi:hypothetical protein
MTHSLGLSVAATALLASGSSMARAQSPAPQAQEPSRPANPSVEDDARDRPREASDIRLTTTSLLDDELTIGTKPKSLLDSWLSSVDMKCISCGGLATSALFPESMNRNAPWVLQGKWRRQTALGVVSTGFVGVRKYALPLYMAMPIGGDFDPGARGSSPANVFAPSTQWSLTGAVEQTLATFSNGATVGVTADVLVPVKTGSIGAGDPRIGALTSRTMRFGIVFRW